MKTPGYEGTQIQGTDVHEAFPRLVTLWYEMRRGLIIRYVYISTHPAHVQLYVTMMSDISIVHLEGFVCFHEAQLKFAPVFRLT